MAINKERNVLIQVTFPKEDAEQLNTLQKAFEQNGIKVTKSVILVQAFRDYLKILVACGTQQDKHEEEEPQGEKKDV